MRLPPSFGMVGGGGGFVFASPSLRPHPPSLPALLCYTFPPPLPTSLVLRLTPLY